MRCRIQDPLLTSTTSLSSINPKQLIGPEYHDYSDHEQYREQMMCEHVTYTEHNDLMEKEIRADTVLSRQLQDEEIGQVLTQMVNNDPTVMVFTFSPAGRWLKHWAHSIVD